MHFAIDTDGTFGGSLSLLEAMTYVYRLGVDVMSRHSYTLTSWLWLPANMSNFLVSNHKPSWCWLGIPKPSNIVFTEISVTKIPIAVIFTSLLSRYVIKTSWIMFLLCLYCVSVHRLKLHSNFRVDKPMCKFCSCNCGFGDSSCI